MLTVYLYCCYSVNVSKCFHVVFDMCTISLYKVLYTNIDQTLMNSLHRLLNCEIGGLDCHVITTEYRTSVHYIHI